MTENIYRRLADEPDRPYNDVVHEAATEVGGPIVTAVSNTIISFIPVFALTDQEGKLFKPLAYTKTFAIGASVLLALTIVPVLSYYVLKPIRWSRWKSLLVGGLLGLTAIFPTHAVLHAGFGTHSRWSGWPMAIGIGIMIAAAVYRMGREQLIPLEKNTVSRGIHWVFRALFRWTLDHKRTFLAIPISLVLLGMTVWLGFARIASPLSTTLNVVGIDVTQNAAWGRLERIFPGIGREFMPPLDEGSLLFMPSLLPSASLTEAQDIVSRQDIAIRSVPEVKSVVGKVGRVESALDPAPIGM